MAELGEKIRQYRTAVALPEFTQTGECEYTLAVAEENARAWKYEPLVGVANRIVLMEDLSEGQSVTSFRLWAYLPTYQKKKILIFEGKTIGHKQICHFGAMRGSKYVLEITGAEGTPKIRDMKAYFIS